MSEEIQGIASGLTMVATNLEALNRRFKDVLSSSQSADASRSLKLLSELAASLRILHVAPKAVIDDTTALAEACDSESDAVAATGSAFAAVCVVYDQLAQHYTESSSVLKNGAKTVRQLKGSVMQSMMDAPAPSKATADVGRRDRDPSEYTTDASVGPNRSDASLGASSPTMSIPEVAVTAIPTMAAMATAPTHTGGRLGRHGSSRHGASAAQAPSGGEVSVSPDPEGLAPEAPRIRRRRHNMLDDEPTPAKKAPVMRDPEPEPEMPPSHRSTPPLEDDNPTPMQTPYQSQPASPEHEDHDNLHGSFDGSSTVSTETKKRNFLQRSVDRTLNAGKTLALAPVTAGKFMVDTASGAVRSTQEGLLRSTYPQLAEEEIVDITNCAWSEGKVLKQGYWFITTKHIAFISTVIRTSFLLRLDEVKNIHKRKSAVVLNNSIELETLDGDTYFLTSFLTRDDSFKTLHTLWTAC